jgi:VPDSG-CTERM motif
MGMSRTTQQWLTTLALVFIASALSSAFALPLAIGDSRDLGLISKNQPANPSSSAGFIDILLNQPLNSGPTSIGANTYTRTGNDPLGGDYPDATYSGVEFGSNVTNINLGSGYQYLLAKYDGQNWGSQLWYVGGLAGTITIPLYGSGDKYEVSHTYLYNPTSTSVPDGGMTAVMLGLSLCGLGVANRLFERKAFRQ